MRQKALKEERIRGVQEKLAQDKAAREKHDKELHEQEILTKERHKAEKLLREKEVARIAELKKNRRKSEIWKRGRGKTYQREKRGWRKKD